MTLKKYRITMRSGPTPGKTFPLEGEEVFLGRDLSNTITISDPEVSRYHARFLIQPEGVKIEDQGSTNGTFINGIRTYGPQPLKNGDMITLGESIVVTFEAINMDPDFTMADNQSKIPSESLPPQETAQTNEVLEQAWHLPPVEVPQPVQAPISSAPVNPQAPFIPQKNSDDTYIADEPKKKKPRLLLIFLLIAIFACIAVALTLTFMPATWWCALTMNALNGCPIP